MVEKGRVEEENHRTIPARLGPNIARCIFTQVLLGIDLELSQGSGGEIGFSISKRDDSTLQSLEKIDPDEKDSPMAWVKKDRISFRDLVDGALQNEVLFESTVMVSRNGVDRSYKISSQFVGGPENWTTSTTITEAPK